MFIDTHCHLDLPPLSSDLPQILRRAVAAGVVQFICPGVAPAGWKGIASTAAANSSISPAFGIHPLHICGCPDDSLAELEKYLPDAVAIGETGLDYTDRDCDRLLQQDIFRRHLRLAGKYSLPIIIHCRRAFADLLRILAEESARTGGVMHAFSGSVETARECIALGLKIGIAGPVTWSGAVKPVQVVRDIPLEHLLLETDSPDLTPQAYRGSMNEPAFLLAVAEKVAAIKGFTLEDVALATTLNVQRIFHVKPASFFTD